MLMIIKFVLKIMELQIYSQHYFIESLIIYHPVVITRVVWQIIQHTIQTVFPGLRVYLHVEHILRGKDTVCNWDKWCVEKKFGLLRNKPRRHEMIVGVGLGLGGT